MGRQLSWESAAFARRTDSSLPTYASAADPAANRQTSRQGYLPATHVQVFIAEPTRLVRQLLLAAVVPCAWRAARRSAGSSIPPSLSLNASSRLRRSSASRAACADIAILLRVVSAAELSLLSVVETVREVALLEGPGLLDVLGDHLYLTASEGIGHLGSGSLQERGFATVLVRLRP